MAEFDRKGLVNFLKGGEKTLPPVFVGREEVLDDIVETAMQSWSRRETTQGYPGNTRIVQGAPGAGKSSILDKLEKRLNAGNPSPGAPRILVLESSQVVDPFTALDLLAKMVDPEAAKDFLSLHQQMRSVGGEIGLFGTHAGGKLETTQTRNVPSPDLTTFMHWVNDRIDGKGMAWPVIIAIDEAQNLTPDRTTPTARLLQGLHSCRPILPLTLVLAGLGDTESMATGMGLTRAKTVKRIGCLEGDDIHNLMTGFCRHFGIDIGSCEYRLRDLAAPTDGWPRHLHCAQEALAEAALAPDMDGRLDRIHDWDGVEAASLRRRNEYYLSRFSPAMRDSQHLVATVMQDLEEDASIVDIKSSIDKHAGKERGWRLPKGMDSDQFFDHLVHQGALEEGKDYIVRSPVPSFQRFLIRRGQPEPPPGKSRVARAAAALHPQFDPRQIRAISYHAESLVKSRGRSELRSWADYGSTLPERRIREMCRQHRPGSFQIEAWGAQIEAARQQAEDIAVAEIFRRVRLAGEVLDEAGKRALADRGFRRPSRPRQGCRRG